MQLNKLSGHVYWLPPDETTDRPVLGVIAGKHGTLVIDAGNSPAHANILLSEMSKHNIAAPSFLVLTHWHWDHVFGTAVFNIPMFAHFETRRVVEEMVHLIDKLLGYKADYYLWGHDPEPMPYVEMVEYTTMLKTIGRVVEKIGDNRGLIIPTLQNQFGKPLNEDDFEIVDCFLAGLTDS